MRLYKVGHWYCGYKISDIATGLTLEAAAKLKAEKTATKKPFEYFEIHYNN